MRNDDRVQRGLNGNDSDFISLPHEVASPMSTAVSKYWTRRVVQRDTLGSGRDREIRQPTLEARNEAWALSCKPVLLHPLAV
jgi:hypothetical protein